MISIRPELWTQDSRREYSSIVSSAAIIHFPLGLTMLISGMIIGYMSYFLDLAVGITLLTSGSIAIFSTLCPSVASVWISGMVSVCSGMTSLALFFDMILLTFWKRLLSYTNPIVWIYIIYATFAFCLEAMQVYVEVNAVRRASYRRGNFSHQISMNSEQGKATGDLTSPTYHPRMTFTARDARSASNS